MTIRLEESLFPVRPASRASRSTQRSTTPRPDSPSKLTRSPPRSSRSLSVQSAERRPLGPRSPSPLPPASPINRRSQVELPSMDDNLTMETAPSASSSHAPPVSGIPRSKRQSFYPNGNTESTPKAINLSSSVVATPIEPLSIKKKTSLRSSTIATGSPTPSRKNHVRSSPLSRNLNRVVSPRRVSPSVRKIKSTIATSTLNSEGFERIRHLSVSTKEDVSCDQSQHIFRFLTNPFQGGDVAEVN